ncbi:unnamed protein product, partial [Owenia fusiformis]
HYSVEEAFFELNMKLLLLISVVAVAIATEQLCSDDCRVSLLEVNECGRCYAGNPDVDNRGCPEGSLAEIDLFEDLCTDTAERNTCCCWPTGSTACNAIEKFWE